jgi:hypothetical protein
MTLMTQMDCCTMLGIGPKTLRNWLRHATMQFSTHPIDARLKCLTEEQVQQLATLHARPLQMAPDPSLAFPQVVTPLAASPKNTAVAQESSAPPISSTSSLLEETELRKTVGVLSAKVLTLQEQMTQLALELLRERTERYEQPLSALEALLPPHATRSLEGKAPVPPLELPPHSPLASPRPLQPAELLARTRILPRIEYQTQGLYVLICPLAGVLSFGVDSSEWFDWLASLVSFRFLGQSGRFSAYREGLTRSWRAYRTFHGRSRKRSLGTTDRLTIAHLEQVAASLQAEISSL